MINKQNKEMYKECLDPKRMLAKNNCPICNGQSIVLLEIPTINPAAPDKVELRECGFCGHWWHSPLPEQQYLCDLYSQDSKFVVGLNIDLRNDNVKQSDLFRFINPILSNFPGNQSFNYLEIGPGSGHALEYFSKKAKYAWGVEPAPVKIRANLVSDIDKVPRDIKFDCIVAQDVLEHLSDPVVMLKKIHKVANPGALFFAGFPNKDSLKAKLMKDKWSMVRPVGHLQYFSKRSIRLMLKNSGWKLVKSRSARIGDLNFWETIKEFNWRERNLTYRLIKSLFLGQLILGKDQWKIQAVVL